MSNTRFITVDYLIDKSMIDKNVDQRLLYKFIDDAQDINIQGVLGGDLYDYIVSKYSSGTMSNIESGLVDLIKPAVVEWAVYNALPFLHIKLTNRGVQELGQENGTNTTIDNVKYLRNISMNNAEFHNKRIIDYICTHSDVFQFYNNFRKVKPDGRYFGGIYVDKRNRRWY